MEIIKVETQNPVRLDKFLANSQSDLTRSRIQKLIENGNITVNGKVCNKKNRSEKTQI